MLFKSSIIYVVYSMVLKMFKKLLQNQLRCFKIKQKEYFPEYITLVKNKHSFPDCFKRAKK